MIALWLWCVVAFAAPLRLSDVLDAVDERLPQLVAASAEIEAAEARLLASRGAFEPTLHAKGVGYASGKYPRRYGDVAMSVRTPLGPEVEVGWRVGEGEFPAYDGYWDTFARGESRIGVSVPLLDGVGMGAERAAARHAAQGVEEAVAMRKTDVVRLRNAAARAWWRWAGAGARVAVEEELLSLAESRQRAVDIQVDKGALAPLDALDAERLLYERRAVAVEARQDLVIAAQALSLWLRDDRGAPVVPSDDRLPPLDPPAFAPVRDDVAVALAARPDLAALDAAIAQAQTTLARATNAVLPKLDATGRVSRDRGIGEVEPVEVRVGVAAEVPVLLRKGRGDRARAAAELDALRAERRLAADRVAVEVASARAAVERARDRLEALEAAADRAAESTRLAVRAFELGATDLFLVLAREDKLAEARRKAVDARVAYGEAIAGYEAALGR